MKITSKPIINVYTQTYITKSIELFKIKEKTGYETRYNSWATCHDYFSELKKGNIGKKFTDLKKVDQQLSLIHLSYYLASWGMYRGSSFVLQYDASIYKNVIEIILKNKYEMLWNLSFDTIKQDKNKVVKLLSEIRDEINKALIGYKKFTNTKGRLPYSVKYDDVSQTLITKILLGTLCCCPAYDNYFTASIGGKFNNFYDDTEIDNLLELVLNNSIFNSLSKKHNYPLMKIVDMAYFNMGIEKGFKKYYETYIDVLKWPSSEEDGKKIVKSLNQFYCKLSGSKAPKVYVAFDCDTNKVEEFIDKYKTQIENELSKR